MDKSTDGAIMQQSSIRVQELNPGRLTSLYRKQFELSNVQRGETIAIIGEYWNSAGIYSVRLWSGRRAWRRHLRDVRKLNSGMDQGWSADNRTVQRYTCRCQRGGSHRHLSRTAFHEVAEGGDGRRHEGPHDH